MRNLFRFILKFHRTILFLFLELICLLLVVNHNYYQKAVFFNSSNRLCGSMYEAYDNVTNFFSLLEENERLAEENAMLRNSMGISITDTIESPEIQDTSKQYIYRYARVVNNTVNRQRNTITINKGRIDGIKEEMAVICDDGVVGVIRSVNEHYSTILPILNKELSISAKLKKNNYFGSLKWDGKDYRKALLKEIPYHTYVSKGDTVVTSGFSSIFPEGIILATVDKHFHEAGENFLDVTVNLNVDFKNLSYVYVIENRSKKEKLETESNISND